MITIIIGEKKLTTEDGLLYDGDDDMADLAEDVAKEADIIYAPSVPLARAEFVCEMLEGEVTDFPPIPYDPKLVY